MSNLTKHKDIKTETYKIFESLDRDIKWAIFGMQTFKDFCKESNYLFDYCDAEGWDVGLLRETAFRIYYNRINALPYQFRQMADDLRKANLDDFVHYWRPFGADWEMDDESEF